MMTSPDLPTLEALAARFENAIRDAVAPPSRARTAPLRRNPHVGLTG
jgi:hypothetical protein